MDSQSSHSFIVAANEAFGYTHEQTLNSSFCVMLAMFKEYGFVINERNKMYDSEGGESLKDGEEWVYITDFETGEKKKFKQSISGI